MIIKMDWFLLFYNKNTVKYYDISYYKKSKDTVMVTHKN